MSEDKARTWTCPHCGRSFPRPDIRILARMVLAGTVTLVTPEEKEMLYGRLHDGPAQAGAES